MSNLKKTAKHFASDKKINISKSLLKSSKKDKIADKEKNKKHVKNKG